MAPPGGNAAINRPRAATNTHASASDNTPATCAAATSPTECPNRKSGRSPNDSDNRNNATPTANNPGCANSVRSSTTPTPANTTHAPSHPSTIEPAHTSSSALANTGNALHSPAPIPARCAPWPGNRKPVRPGARRGAPDHGDVRYAVRQQGEGAVEVRPLPGDHHRAVLEPAPGRGEAQADTGWIDGWIDCWAGDRRGQPGRLRPQRCLGSTGHQPRQESLDRRGLGPLGGRAPRSPRARWCR